MNRSMEGGLARSRWVAKAAAPSDRSCAANRSQISSRRLPINTRSPPAANRAAVARPIRHRLVVEQAAAISALLGNRAMKPRLYVDPSHVHTDPSAANGHLEVLQLQRRRDLLVRRDWRHGRRGHGVELKTGHRKACLSRNSSVPILHEYYGGTEGFAGTTICPEEWLATPTP
jgi:hypothetical protein